MGEVYRATDTKLDRQVAIKVLPAAFTEDKERLARFEREAKLLAQLHHPNIASIFGLEESAGTRALVLELVEGPTLAERLEQGPLPFTETLSVSLQIAQALEEAHEKGIVHRDLKPQNIKAPIEGKVKVLDFGLAKAMDPAAGSAASAADLARSPTLMQSPTLTAVHGTQLGVILGTAAYMAPEQAKGLPIDKRADIWAFGVVLWEMLTGRRLFAGESTAETLAAVIRADIDLESVPEETPFAVRDLLRRCLVRNPKSRLRDIGDARIVLEEASAGRGGVEAVAGATRSSSSSRRAVTALTALAAGFALLFVAALVLQREAAAPVSELGVVRFPLSADPTLVLYTDLTTPFATSPDGKTIVFSAAADGVPQHLWARTLDDPRPRRLEGTEGGSQPAISPDGEWLAFLVRSRQIRKVRLHGGPVIDVAALTNVSAALAWASNDEILFEVIGVDSGIHRVGASGGEPEELIPIDRAEGEVRQRRPFVLGPEQIVVYASTTADGRTTLALHSLADGRRAPLDLAGVQALGMFDGRLVYARGDGNLMAVPLDLRAMLVTGAAVELPDRVASSPIGTRVALAASGTLVYRSGSTSSRLVLVDSQGRSRPLGTQEGAFEGPRFSPDGRRVVAELGFGVTGGAAAVSAKDLLLFDRDSGEATRLTRTGTASKPEWSADGSRLVYIEQSSSNRREVWTLPLDGSARASRLVEIDGEPVSAVLTPDGRSVIVVLELAGGAGNELVRVALDGTATVTPLAGPSIPSSARRPILPRVSPDGRSLAFGDRGEWEVFVRALDGHGLLQVTDGNGWGSAWSADSQRLFYSNNNSLEVAELRGVPLAVVERRTVVTLPHNVEEFDVSPDGETFVFVAPASPASDVLVAVNWSEALRREWHENDERAP